MPVEKKPRQGKRKIKKLCSSIPHTTTTFDLVVPLQFPVQHLLETYPQRNSKAAVQKGNSDYLQESLPGRVTVLTEAVTQQSSVELQQVPQSRNEQRNEFSLISLLQQEASNMVPTNEERKSEELQSSLSRGQQTIPSSVDEEGRSTNENV